jgi:hypothetical protein
MATVNEEKLYMILSEMLSSIEENPNMRETELRNTYIIQMLYALGWSDSNIESEKGVEFATRNYRVDYELSYKGKSKVAIEIKRPSVQIGNGEKQLGDYLLKLKSDIGIAFNGKSLIVMNTNGKQLISWNLDERKNIPENVKDLIGILKKYLAYDSAVKENFGKENEIKEINEPKEGIDSELNADNGITSESLNKNSKGNTFYTIIKRDTYILLIIGLIVVLIVIYGLLSYFTQKSYFTQNTPIPVTVHNNTFLIKHILLNFSPNVVGGTFCFQSDNPYTYRRLNLYAGENITWVLNQSLSIATAFVLNNQSSLNSLTDMIRNATALFLNYSNNCNLSSDGYTYSNLSFCKNYFNTHESDGVLMPYITVQNNLQALNPVIISLPSEYVNSINFTAPVTGTYYFVLFSSELNPFIVGETIEPVSNICYSDSYIYNTTVPTVR